jgi:hypothetical protein
MKKSLFVSGQFIDPQTHRKGQVVPKWLECKTTPESL